MRFRISAAPLPTAILGLILSLTLGLILGLALPSTQAQAQSSTDDLTRWKQEEQSCINNCPKFPRYGGIETDEQYQARIEAENAYNQCYYKCTREYQNKLRIPFAPFDDGSKAYYKRNNTPQ